MKLIRTSSLLGCAVLALAATAGSAQADILYGISNGFGGAADNRIYEINPANGDLTNINQVTLAGFTVTRSLALAARPSDGTLFAVIQTGSGAGNRRLVTIDPSTGVSTSIGSLADQVSSLSFRADGTLYGVVGDGGDAAETLFQISTANATMTLQFALGNGTDGETIAFHGNGLLYHSSGNATALFESVDVNTQIVTPIGSASGEAFAMGYSATLGQMFLSDISSRLYTVDIATGARTLLGDMADQLGNSDNRGLAFVVPAPGAAALLGLGGLCLVRRRRN